jgi:hypothetical protein
VGRQKNIKSSCLEIIKGENTRGLTSFLKEEKIASSSSDANNC